MSRLIKYVAEHCPKSVADWLIMRHDHDVADNALYFHLAFERLHDMQWESEDQVNAGLGHYMLPATYEEIELYHRCAIMVQY
jgi:hypothetical protein